MKQSTGNFWITFVVTPFVAAGIVAGLGLAVEAAYENIRLARATSQILGTVAAAREVGLDPSVTHDRATFGLLERLSHIDRMHVITDESKGWPYMLNPWGGQLSVVVQPSIKQIGLEMWLPSPVCPKLLLFFAKDIESLGMKRVDVRNVNQGGVDDRILYDVQDGNDARQLDQASILTGCKTKGPVVLKLTFGLR